MTPDNLDIAYWTDKKNYTRRIDLSDIYYIWYLDGMWILSEAGLVKATYHPNGEYQYSRYEIPSKYLTIFKMHCEKEKIKLL